MPKLRSLTLALLFGLSMPNATFGSFTASKTLELISDLDEDGDGLDEDLEEQIGTNPLEPDTDGDGWDDLAELVSLTDPTDPRDFPRFAAEAIPTGGAGGDPSLRLRTIELLQMRGLPRSTGKTAASSGSGVSIRYYYLDEKAPKLAIEMIRDDLKPGSYLLIWKHALTWNPLESEQRYAVSIRDDEGRTLAEWLTPAPVDHEWLHVGLPFQLKAKDAGRRITISLIPETGQEREYSLADFVVVPAGLESDVNRDGFITDNERPENGRPLRHWINDDDDRGECQLKADLPGRPSGQADHSQPGVDGLRDLVDFLPINLNITRVARLMTPSQGFRYHLRNADRAAQIVLTGLTPATAGAIHRNPSLQAFGPSLTGTANSAEVMRPDAQGRIEIPQRFVERIADLGHGIILLEGARKSQLPLRLEISQGGHPILSLEQPLSLSSVESMYRHVSVCSSSYEYSGERATVRKIPRARQMGSPEGLPDEETSDRWVVMIHGYNVSGEDARAWHAESFKRLRALGSNARFVGVTWNGDTGLDYHKAVYQAFQAGDVLPHSLNPVVPAKTLLMAHSLGNVVACQSIQAGFTPAHFFLLNAALPIEALSGETGTNGQAQEMTEELWRPYQGRLNAAHWARARPAGDQRRGYTWTNTFSRVRMLSNVTNCYSPGEDVTNCPGEMTSASVLATAWSGRAIDYGVWKTQELLKGVGWSRSLGAIAMERAQAGWGFNPAWRGRYVPHGPKPTAGGHFERLTPDEAAGLTESQLRPNPFFAPFRESWLQLPRQAGSSAPPDAPHIKYDLLARAIPALSYAAGAAAVPTAGIQGRFRNLDLETNGRRVDRWPSEGHGSPTATGRWLHSDFKNVALPYVHPLFARMISDASLR